MQVTYYPNKILRQPTKEIEKFDDNLANTAKEMIKIMREDKGVGLAGPQVSLDQAIVVIEPQPGKTKVLINPTITNNSQDMTLSEEGCLSFPGIFGIVPRYKKVTINYQDLNGKKHKLKAKDFLSYVLQHEIDHLNGNLFIDKLIKIRQGEDKLKSLLKEANETIKLYE